MSVSGIPGINPCGIFVIELLRSNNKAYAILRVGNMAYTNTRKGSAYSIIQLRTHFQNAQKCFNCMGSLYRFVLIDIMGNVI